MKTEIAENSRRSFLTTLLKLPLIPAALLISRHAGAGPVPAARRVLMNDFLIAGFQYYQGPDVYELLQPGVALALRPEPANPHDVFAVGIFLGHNKLGYVPRKCNRHVSRLLLDGVPLVCVIERLNEPEPAWGAVHVRISLPIPA